MKKEGQPGAPGSRPLLDANLGHQMVSRRSL